MFTTLFIRQSISAASWGVELGEINDVVVCTLYHGSMKVAYITL